ncbi:MAG: phosphate signaling complex protein PhoU [Mariprofundales bacterium]
MSTHTSSRFDEDLKDLKQHMLKMGAEVESALIKTSKALIELDIEAAQAVIRDDDAINQMEIEGDEMCVNLFVRWQPAAGDLRFVMSASKIISDLERMGDSISVIAEHIVSLGNQPVSEYNVLPNLLERSRKQVRRVLNSLAQDNAKSAMKVIKKDRRVDELYQNVERDMLDTMRQQPEFLNTAIAVMHIARQLERVSDYATDIAEMVVYSVRAHDIRHISTEEASNIVKNS